jgi:hypothetical protein
VDSQQKKDEWAAAVGLAAYVGVCALAWGAWKITDRWGWGVPGALLAVPAVLGGLVIHPAAEWFERLRRPTRPGTTDS